VRYAETLGDLADRQIAVIAERDDDLVIGRQPRDGGADDVAVIDTAGLITCRESDLGGDVGRPAARRAQPKFPAGVDESGRTTARTRMDRAGSPPPRLDEGVMVASCASAGSRRMARARRYALSRCSSASRTKKAASRRRVSGYVPVRVLPTQRPLTIGSMT
jgi:hypothetical protein